MDRPSSDQGRTGRKAVTGAVWGNFVDQVDIFLPVIALAPAAARLYGPAGAAAQTGVVFVATLLGRPLGAALFGHLADRHGRTMTTQVAIGGVAATTLALAAVPDHTVLGAGTVWAFVVLRFLGGIFLGGQYTAAVPLAMEWSAPRRRGLVSGLVMAMSPLANSAIAALTLLLVAVLGADGYASGGWRISFVIGGLLAAVMLGYYRRGVRDSVVATAERPASTSSSTASSTSTAAPSTTSPFVAVVAGPWRRQLAQVVLLMTGLWLYVQLTIPVLTAGLKVHPGLTPADVPLIMLFASLALVLGIAVAGALSQVVGRRRLLVGFGLATAVLAPASYLAVGSARGLVAVTAAVVATQLTTSSGFGPIGAYLSERFPGAVRSTGYGVGYSVSIVLPSLYPFWLPPLQARLGATTAAAALLVLGGLLIALGAALGPEPDRSAPLPD